MRRLLSPLRTPITSLKEQPAMFAHLLTRITGIGHTTVHVLRCRLLAATRPAAISLIAGTLADLVRSKPALIAENALLRQQLRGRLRTR